MNYRFGRWYAWLGILCILVLTSSMALAQNSTIVEVQYSKALDILSSISLNDNEALKSVYDMLENVSGYQHASKYKLVVEALIVLNNKDESEFILRSHEIRLYLNMLIEDPVFSQDYAEHELLSELLPLEMLIAYIDGRKTELDGKPEEAAALYRNSKILDSIDRYVRIGSGKLAEMYEQAERFRQEAKYGEAAVIYRLLAENKYGDSEFKYQLMMSLVSTPTPAPTKSPTAEPNKPTSTPLPTQTEEAVIGKWSSWGALPKEVSDSKEKYEIQSRKQYRFRDKSTTTSSSSAMSGWSLEKTTTSWGSWSSWSTTVVSGSSTVEVETKTESTSITKTQYRYWRWLWKKVSDGVWHSSRNLPSDKTSYTDERRDYTPWLDTALSSSYSANWGGTVYVYSGKTYPHPETRTVDGGTVKTTYYRSRKQVTTYHFYKWSTWSSWSTTKPSENNAREVDNRIQYRYKLK